LKLVKLFSQMFLKVRNKFISIKNISKWCCHLALPNEVLMFCLTVLISKNKIVRYLIVFYVPWAGQSYFLVHQSVLRSSYVKQCYSIGRIGNCEYSIYVAGICRNPAFPEMPRQFRKCLGSCRVRFKKYLFLLCSKSGKR